MEAVLDRRGIIDRLALSEALVAIATGEASAGRPAVLAALKSALSAGRAEIRRRFEADDNGRRAAAETCFLLDQLIRGLHEYTATAVFPLANPSAAERLALVAVGGYGRGELAPHSDVDILFLLPYKLTPHGEQVIEYLLYHLWDLGLKIGQATRSVDDCLRQAKADMTIRTGLLEARFLTGDDKLFAELRQRFAKEVMAGTGIAFVEAKLAERDERHRRLGNSRYALEPNIKDGKGGLRDLHALFWIAKYLYRVDDIATLVNGEVFAAAEVASFKKAEAFLWSVRVHLHYLAGRAEERLTFDLQPEIARRLGYTDHAGAKGVERLMKHYFLIAKSVGDLTRIFCAALEAAHQRRARVRLPVFGLLRREVEGFRVDAGRLKISGAEALARRPVDLLRIFEVAQRHRLDIHPATLRLITQNLRLIDRGLRDDPEANRLFLAMLTSTQDCEATLRRLSEAGVFGRFVPDFGRVVAQMQYDMYHHYTVDEHTLFAIGILSRIEQGLLKDEVPIASAVVHQLLSRRVLYLAVLLHDIAKGRGGDHSELGAEVALKLCPRLGLSDEETETVAWLVRWHLLMSNTAFKRDIDDPQTIIDFAGQVQSLERLRLLLVLTVADIRAVGPKTWNGWKAQLLRELYYRTEEQLSGGLLAEGREARVAAAERMLAAELADWSADDIATHRARGTPAYWLAFDAKTLARQARLVRNAESAGQELSIETRVDQWRAVTEVTIYTPDRHGLFALLAGAIAATGGNIVDARIFTLTNGMALDSFWVQDAEGGPFDRPDRLARLSAMVERTLAGGALPDPDKRLSALPSRFAVFPVVSRVLIDNKASATHTVIEVNGRDRPGLLYRLTSALSELKLQISSAKISTFGQRAVDVFYVKDLFGLKIAAEPKLKVIHARLLEALDDRQPVDPPAPAFIPTDLAEPDDAASAAQ
ncbi:MAG: [protein-PII] uridylyltransferase [Dongiaceae bacterium]